MRLLLIIILLIPLLEGCAHDPVNYEKICETPEVDGWMLVKKPTEEMLSFDWIDSTDKGIKVYLVNVDGRVRMCKRPIGVSLCASFHQTELLEGSTYRGNSINEIMVSTCGNPY